MKLDQQKRSKAVSRSQCYVDTSYLKLVSEVLADSYKLQSFLLIIERVRPCHSSCRHALHILARFYYVSAFVYKYTARLGHLQECKLSVVLFRKLQAAVLYTVQLF
jgi:hypothetical protein